MMSTSDLSECFIIARRRITRNGRNPALTCAGTSSLLLATRTAGELPLPMIEGTVAATTAVVADTNTTAVEARASDSEADVVAADSADCCSYCSVVTPP